MFPSGISRDPLMGFKTICEFLVSLIDETDCSYVGYGGCGGYGGYGEGKYLKAS